ncbi:MAG: cellulase family glycosylhydrolase [Phycisphaerae bacterium]|nr:cellulase family glycosylhydrolase [Phycisphaerae bacterium]
MKRLSLVVVVLLLPICTATSPASGANDKLEFWNRQRKGANGGGGADQQAWFRAAAGFGIEFIRLTPVTWKGAGRDFLIGNADDFKGIPPADLAKLKTALDIAHRNNVRIVLVMFELPGARYSQHNDDKFDYRLWTDERYQTQALAFWTELACQLKDHPAIVAYNPLNEPHPARKDGFMSGSTEGFGEWLAKHRGTTADLNRFNKRVVAAIRQVDPKVPILLDCWFHAAPEGFAYLEPVADQAVLYSFHAYNSWQYVTHRVNKGRFAYPDRMPTDTPRRTRRWTPADLLAGYLPVIDWMKKYKISPERVVAGELGCDRRVEGAAQFLTDTIAVLNDHHWHWAFYAFRSPDWDGLDYELGTEELGPKYWQAREQGKTHEELIHRHDNPLWDVIKRELARE